MYTYIYIYYMYIYIYIYIYIYLWLSVFVLEGAGGAFLGCVDTNPAASFFLLSGYAGCEALRLGGIDARASARHPRPGAHKGKYIKILVYVLLIIHALYYVYIYKYIYTICLHIYITIVVFYYIGIDARASARHPRPRTYKGIFCLYLRLS